jgi:hypothetical protein
LESSRCGDWTPVEHSEIRDDAHISGAWPGCGWAAAIPVAARLWVGGALMCEVKTASP